jgi:hypothetical protein
MRHPVYVHPIIILLCLFLVLGCSKKEEPIQTPAPAPVQQAVPAHKDTTQESQLDKAVVIHKDFVQAFSETLGKEDTADILRSRIDLVDKTRISCMMLRPDIHDPVAADFLIRFSDDLQKYLDLANKHLATFEEAARQYASGKEFEANLPRVPEKEKGQATEKLNSLIAKHNELVQGPLKKEQDELNRLGDELLRFK